MEMESTKQESGKELALCINKGTKPGAELKGNKNIKMEINSAEKNMENEDFDSRYKNMEMEDAMIFGSDSWLKHCFEMEEDKKPEKSEERKPVIIEATKKSPEISKIPPKVKKKPKQLEKLRNHSGSKRIAKNQEKTVSKKVAKTKDYKSCTRYIVDDKATPINREETSELDQDRTSLCIFKCLECNVSYGSWNSLRYHMKNKHKKATKLADFEKLVTKLAFHSCKICSKKIFRDSHFLSEHMRTKHQLNLSEYKHQYFQNSYYETLAKGAGLKGDKHIKMEINFSEKDMENEDLDSRYKNMEIEDVMTFGSDSWLKHSFEMEEDKKLMKSEERKPVIIEANKKSPEISKVSPEVKKKTKQLGKLKNDSDSKIIAKSKDKINSSQVAKTKANKICPKKIVAAKSTGTLKDSASDLDHFGTSLCKFKCPECKAICTSWSSLRHHMRRTHNASASMTDLEKLATKLEIYVCKICSKKVFRDPYFLCKHLRTDHQLTLSEYKHQYFQNTYHKTLAKGTLSKDKIGCLSTFRCPCCQNLYMTLDSFHNHMRKHWEQSPRELGQCYWHKYLETIITHKCKLCSKLLLCDIRTIKVHIRHHGFKRIREYAQETCCYIDNIVGKCGKIKQANDITKSAETLRDKVGNFCLYACDVCSYVSRSWSSMVNHLRQNGHKSSGNSKSWHSYITNTILHNCKICGKTVLNDRSLLHNHLRKTHRKTVPQYVKEYGLKQVKRIKSGNHDNKSF